MLLTPPPNAEGPRCHTVGCVGFYDDPRMLAGTSLVLGVLASGICFTKSPTAGATPELDTAIASSPALAHPGMTVPGPSPCICLCDAYRAANSLER